MFRNLRRLRDWLTLKDYEDAKEAATRQVVTRFSRGNVAMQNGWYLDDKELRDLSAKGDEAIEKLKQSGPA